MRHEPDRSYLNDEVERPTTMPAIDFSKGLDKTLSLAKQSLESLNATSLPTHIEELQNSFRDISTFAKSKVCGLKSAPGLQPNTCKRAICPRCSYRAKAVRLAILTSRLNADSGLLAFHLRLSTARRSPDLAATWNEFQSIFRDAGLQKALTRKTAGILWQDGITIRADGTWNVHRHLVIAATPEQADEVPSIASAFVAAASRAGVAAAEHAQDLDPINSANVYPVIAYVMDQLGSEHVADDMTSQTPGELLAQAYDDETALDAFHEIEAAIFKRRTGGSSGILSPKKTGATP